jgi:SAM-dependent methyltransferase
MTDEPIRVSPNWLALREPADAAARSRDLAEALDRKLPPGGSWVIHDLGCGTGSMGRWLAPLLSGPQHWVLHDRDADLLALATADAPGPAADGAPVTVEARQTDLAVMGADDFDGASLITASALLDMLTADELDRLVGLCAGVGCPVLLTLSVIGEVEMEPAEPLDRRVAAAFNAHQRRATERGSLLGPDAVDFAAEAFRRLGAEALVRPSPWRLGPAQSALTAEWFAGWVGAAREQEPELAAEFEPHARRRLEQASAGELTVTVGHADLLVLP